MPIVVNQELIPRELIQEEERRLAQSAEWQALPDSLEKTLRLREAVEWSLIDAILLRQESAKDARAIDPTLVAAEVQRLTAAQTCRVLFDDTPLARQVEAQLRIDRTLRNLIGPLPEPTEQEIARLYKSHRTSFARPETVEAAHIVKHVDEMHPELEARTAIEDALVALEHGEPFAAVAERFSDCKGNGGDLGRCQRGGMVQEFEDQIFALQPGQRTSIFRTPFGFHIAEVRSKTPAHIPNLREMRETIKGLILAMREQEAATRVRERLRARARIRRISSREPLAGEPAVERA